MLFLQINFFLQLHTAIYDPSSPQSIPPSHFVRALVFNRLTSFAHVASNKQIEGFRESFLQLQNTSDIELLLIFLNEHDCCKFKKKLLYIK